MTARPHLAPGFVLLVAAGGAVGTAARALLAEALPAQGGWPIGTLAANLAGAFLLGLLLSWLMRRGPETAARRSARLALGTGLLGGFTTYSTFALEVERALADSQPAVGLGYAAVTVLLGLAACLAGVALGGRARLRVGAA